MAAVSSSCFYSLSLFLFLLAGPVTCLLEEPCCRSWTRNDWTEINGRLPPDPKPVCKDGVTRTKLVRGQTLLIHFRPNHRYGILGISACRDEEQSDCYVADIYGLTSGKIGYWWRKHSRLEEGSNRWVPGRKEWLNSTVITHQKTVSQGTWDLDAGTTYDFYVERTLDGRFVVRLDGGDAEQQRDMAFTIPDHYLWISVASYFEAGKAVVAGAGGCFKYERMRFRPGQDVRVYWRSPAGALGLSLCSDSGFSECFVLDMFGLKNQKLNYWFRSHSQKETGGEGWVPGRDSKLPERLIKQGPSTDLGWDASEYKFVFHRELDGTLKVKAESVDPLQDLVFQIPKRYQFGAIANLEYLNGYLKILGPCYNGEAFGYISPTCNHAISLEGIPRSGSGELESIWTPSHGATRSQMRSPPLRKASNLERLCVSVSGLVSEGGRVIVDAVPADGDPADSLRIGELMDNGVSPPDWQHVRLFADIPANLQDTQWVLTLTAEKPAESLVMLRNAELCSSDGCGIATPKGSAFIALGSNASVAEFPWHVGIFLKPSLQLICGGTLVRADVVISAAHCFHNKNDVLQDKSNYKLAVGKLSNNISEEEPSQQTSDIMSIHIPERYRGSKRVFEHDIAVIIAKFSVNSVILPVCIDWSGRSIPTLRVGDVGLVAGWGLTENQVASKTLLFARLPYVPFDQCARVVPSSFLPFITADKFCAGNVNGATVKPGDSGGGLSFQTAGLFYIRGVVSTGVPGQLTYSTFIDISYFLPWIKSILNTIQKK